VLPDERAGEGSADATAGKADQLLSRSRREALKNFLDAWSAVRQRVTYRLEVGPGRR
jgi:type IV pilus biogenesis protein CpaD/CtpE